jgi:hypothetical protein
MALPALALRSTVHARKLRDRATRARGRAVGFQGGGGQLESRRGRPDRPGRSAARSAAAVGGRLRGPEPRAARAGDRRRTQRHPDPALVRRGADAERRSQSAVSRRRGIAGRGNRHQGDGGTGAALPHPRSVAHARASLGGGRRGPEPAGAGRARPDRLRRPRAGLSQRRGRATTAGGDAQHSGRDRPPGGAERHADVVAPRVRRRVHRGARGRAVADRPRRRLARGGRMDDAGAAAVNRVASALVCDLGAAPSRGQRRSASADRHAHLLRVCGPHPPAAREPPAQPAGRPDPPRRPSPRWTCPRHRAPTRR